MDIITNQLNTLFCTWVSYMSHCIHQICVNDISFIICSFVICFTVHVIANAAILAFFINCSFLLIFRCFNRGPNHHGNQIGFHWSHTPSLQHLMLSCSNDACHKGSIAQGTTLLLPFNMNLLLYSPPDCHAGTYSSITLSASLYVFFCLISLPLFVCLSLSYTHTALVHTLLIVLAGLYVGKDLVLVILSFIHLFHVFVTYTIGPQACVIIV